MCPHLRVKKLVTKEKIEGVFDNHQSLLMAALDCMALGQFFRVMMKTSVTILIAIFSIHPLLTFDKIRQEALEAGGADGDGEAPPATPKKRKAKGNGKQDISLPR